MTIKSFICQVIFFLLLCTPSFPDNTSELNDDIKTDTINKLANMLNEYVFQEIGGKTSKMLIENLKDGRYSKITDFRHFAEKLTKDMYEITKDKHLLIRYSPNEIANIKSLASKESVNNNLDYKLYQKELSAKRDNHGFREIKIYPGNIGYIRTDEFERIEFSNEVAHAAMAFVSNSDAIIFDLRNNNGGWGSLVQILCSYFIDFNDENNNGLLFEKVTPYNNEIIQYRVIPDLPGPRLINVPVYILTSSQTYSAAEIFTDVLQKRGIATVIGERTKGGANSTRGPQILNDHFIVKIPVGQMINSYTNTNWEGSGISPNIETDSKDALDTALKSILGEQIKKQPDENYLNSLGYDLLEENKIYLAIDIFMENVKLYPSSANCYDSLAEAYYMDGQIELAITNYEESLKLDDKNENARIMLKRIRNQ